MRLIRRAEMNHPLALVAHKTGINVGTLSEIERGLFRATDEQKTKLAKYYKRPFDELMKDAPKVAA